jgi:hypothetical protein
LTSFVSEQMMFKVVADMAKIALQADPNLKIGQKENGIPYPKIDYEVYSGSDLHINSEFIEKASQVWSDVKTESDLVSSVVIYKVRLQEIVDEVTGIINCVVTVEFNTLFEEVMGASVDIFNQFLSEAVQYHYLACNPPFWIFDLNHWDTVLDFVLYSFFNNSGFIKGTFMLSCWNPESLKHGVYKSTAANLLGHSSYDEDFSLVQYTFGFRQVFI